MRIAIIISLAGLLWSCTGGPEQEDWDPIVECYVERFETKGLDYNKEMQEVLASLKNEGFLIKGGKPEDFIDALNKMKDRTFPYLVNVDADDIEKQLHLVSLRGCVKDHMHDDKETHNTVMSMDQIYIYEFEHFEDFDQHLDMTIDLLKSFNGSTWQEPFNIYMTILLFEEYKRLSIESAIDDEMLKEELVLPPPPPPVAPPPPPAPPEEIEILEEDYEEEEVIMIEPPAVSTDSLH